VTGIRNLEKPNHDNLIDIGRGLYNIRGATEGHNPERWWEELHEEILTHANGGAGAVGAFAQAVPYTVAVTHFPTLQGRELTYSTQTVADEISGKYEKPSVVRIGRSCPRNGL